MKIKLLHAFFAFTIMSMVSCAKELNITSDEDSEEMVPISLSVPITRGTMPASEDDFTSLRMFVFKTNSTGYEQGDLIYNKLIDVEENFTSEITFNRVIVPVGYINIYFVANEISAGITKNEMDAISTVAQLKAKCATYTSATMLTPPFLMYSEYLKVKVDVEGKMTINGSDFPQASKNIEVERIVSKLELNLSCVKSLLPIISTSSLTIAKIEVVNMPKTPYLIPGVQYATERGFLTYSVTDFSRMLDYTVPTGFTTKSGQNLVVYIPEHIIVDAGNRTILKIWGKIDDTDIDDPWEIIIGDGIQDYPLTKLPDNLALSAYRITRNMHYKITAIIKSVPGYNGLEVQAMIQDWNTITIDNEL